MLLSLDRTRQLFIGYVALFVVLFSALPAFADGNVFTDPSNLSVWSVMGPSGGDVRVVAIDPRDKDRLYISTLDGQVHTSD